MHTLRIPYHMTIALQDDDAKGTVDGYAYTVARCTVVENAMRDATVNMVASSACNAAAVCALPDAVNVSVAYTVAPTDTAVTTARSRGPASMVDHTVAPTVAAAKRARSRGAAAATPTTLISSHKEPTALDLASVSWQAKIRKM